jgi:hypothetical protein
LLDWAKVSCNDTKQALMMDVLGSGQLNYAARVFNSAINSVIPSEDHLTDGQKYFWANRVHRELLMEKDGKRTLVSI